MFPNFIIIGAAKTGTTSLYNYLNLHPEVFMSQEKELDFFCSDKVFGKGIDWYQSNFEDAKLSNAKAVGEASVSYSKFPFFDNVPEKIQTYIPNSKFIYVLRDPVERTISHFKHNYISGLETRPLHQIMESPDNIYIATSKYYMQISRYTQFYPKEKIQIITSEKLRKDRLNTLQSVFRFLEVDETFYDPKFDMLHNVTTSKRIGQFLERLRMKNLVKKYYPSFLWNSTHKVLNFFNSNEPQFVVDDEIKSIVSSYLVEDLQQLSEFTNYEIEYTNEKVRLSA